MMRLTCQRTQFIDPVIEDKIFFMGTKPSIKLFENAVDFEFSEESFGSAGQIIFQNANLFNFNAAFKENLKTLERNHQIEIREGCLLYRTSIERIFDYSQLEQFLIEDLSKAFARYFDSKHLSSLKVDVFRDLKMEKIKVLFHTDETMSIPEFEELLYKTEINMLEFMVNPHSNLDALTADQMLQLNSIWQRFYLAQSLPVLKQFFQLSTNVQPENVDKLLNLTVNLNVKNAIIGSQVQIGGNLLMGDKL